MDIEITDIERVIVGYLIPRFPNASVPAATIAAYVEDLADIPPELLRLAARKHAADHNWFPSLHELRQAATALAGPPVRSGLQAWNEVKRAVYVHGYLRRPVFEDPIIAELVAGWGWENICLSEDETADRARFIQAYEQMAARALEQARQAPDVRDFAAQRGPATQIMAGLTARLSSPRR